MKRTFFIILALVLAGTHTFAGGGSASRTAPDSLNVMMWSRDIAVSGEMEYYRELERQTGTRANITTVHSSEWSTRTNLMFASGDYPDIILRGTIDVEMYGVDQRILVPIQDYVNRYMPNYRALLNRDPSIADFIRASNGNTYYTAWLLPQNINVARHLFINKTWLDRVGLGIPNTFAELENALRAFKGRDLNRNGRDDEFPHSGIMTGNENILEFLSFFGIPYHVLWLHITDDHRVVSQLQHRNFRAAMEAINRWYTDGLIDIEALTQNLSSFEAKINNEQVGMFWRWRMIAMLSPDEIVEQYVGILPPAAVAGVTPQVSRFLELPSRGAYITTASRDIPLAARWVDAQYEFYTMLNGYYGPYKEVMQGGSLMRYGWQRASNGRIDFHAADLEQIPNQSAIHSFSGPEYFERFNMPIQRIEKTELCEKYTNAGNVERNAAAILANLVTMPPADMNRRDLLNAQIDTFALESINNFITRGVTDASWNTFNNTLRNLRIDEYIQLYQAAYDRYRRGLN